MTLKMIQIEVLVSEKCFIEREKNELDSFTQILSMHLISPLDDCNGHLDIFYEDVTTITDLETL